MSKTLILKPRQPATTPEGKQTYGWHDYYVLGNALNVIATGKDSAKAYVFMSIAAKSMLQAEEVGLDSGNLVPVSVEINNQEAKLLWKELSRLRIESFGNGKTPPPLGPLFVMLQDIAAQLGYELPKDEDDEE